MCRVALELKEGQETRCIVFWRKNMPRGILPSLKRKTNYQQPPMYVFLHSNQTNNLTFHCFECRPRQSLPTAPFTFLMSSAVRPVGLVCHSGQPLAPHLTDGHSHSHTISGSQIQIHIYKYKYKYTPALMVIPTTMSSAKQP